MAADSNYIYWDSCVFIDGFRKTAGRIEHITKIEGEAKAGKFYIYASTMAIAEVVKLRDYGLLTDEEERQIAAYFRHKFIRIIPVDRIVARQAAQIVREHGLKPPDSIHVATALRARCSVLYTYDEEMLSKDKLVGDPAVPIKRPGDVWSETMF